MDTEKKETSYVCPRCAICGLDKKTRGRKRLPPEELAKRVEQHREKMRLRYWQKKELLAKLSAQVSAQSVST